MDDSVAEALDLLGDIPHWRLALERWDLVDEILQRLERCLARRDWPGARAAVADLERSGPVRITRIGTADLREVSVQTMARRNALVHTLAVIKAGELRSTGEERQGARPHAS